MFNKCKDANKVAAPSSSVFKATLLILSYQVIELPITPFVTWAIKTGFENKGFLADSMPMGGSPFNYQTLLFCLFSLSFILKIKCK